MCIGNVQLADGGSLISKTFSDSHSSMLVILVNATNMFDELISFHAGPGSLTYTIIIVIEHT